MNYLLRLDIIELAKIAIALNASDRLNSKFIISTLKAEKPFHYRSLTQSQVKKEIESLFPLFKNNHKGTKNYKITEELLNSVIQREKINLRPIEHAKAELTEYFH